MSDPEGQTVLEQENPAPVGAAQTVADDSPASEASAQEPQYIYKNDPKGAEAALAVMRLLGDDVVFKKDQHEEYLPAVLEGIAVKGEGDKIDWAATADQLIHSFDALVPDKFVQKDDKLQLVESQGMSMESAAYLKQIMVSQGDVSAVQMAGVLQEAKGPDKKKSLYNYLDEQNHIDNMVFTREALLAIRELLRQFSPALADAFDSVIGMMVHDPHEEMVLEAPENDRIAAIYDVMKGAPNHMAEFLGMEDGNEHLWIPPTNSGDIQEFMHGTGYVGGGENNNYLGKFRVQNFEAMITQNLVGNGDASFETEAAKGRFAQNVEVALYGAPITKEAFVAAFKDGGLEQYIKIEGDPALQDKVLTNLFSELEGKNIDPERAAMILMREIKTNALAGLPDMAEGGFSERKVQAAFEKVFEGFQPAGNAVEFAARMREFDKNDPEYKLAGKPAPEDKQEIESAQKIERMSEQARVQYEYIPSPAGGKPALAKEVDGGKITIGEDSAPDKFNHCAEGRNAIPCKFNEPDVPVNPPARDLMEGVPTWESVVDNLLKSPGR